MRSTSERPGVVIVHRAGIAGALFVSLMLAGCQRGGFASSAHGASDDGMTCAERKADLTTFVRYLPDTALTVPLKVALPEATLGSVPQRGTLLEVGPNEVAYEGERFANDDLKARVDWLASKLEGLSSTPSAGTEDDSAKRPVMLVAASFDSDVRSLRRYLEAVPAGVELRLLFRVPTVRLSEEGDADARAFSARVLAERDPKKRQELAREGFAKYSSCDGVEEAVESVEGASEDQRWPRLKQGLSRALSQCDCDELDAGALKQLIVAEQRAGTMALGSIPLDFMRDERCGASMPLRSMQKLLRQIESFDQEFAGSWKNDELSFEGVVTDERLLNYFCDALPGETLAALERARSTLYWKLPTGQCQAWQFEPMSSGAPMGTWRRVGEGPGASGLAFHYWQGAEQIRVYGPASPKSKPTDREPWACETEYELKGVDESSVRLTGGRWFFTDEACQKAPQKSAMATSCVVQRALGAQPSESQPSNTEPGTTSPESQPSGAEASKTSLE